jgi:hypothetical protein
MKIQIKSNLDSIATDVFAASNVIDAKRIFIDHVSNSRIKESDKAKMLTEVSRMSNLLQLHRYTANALLKYEGLGL